MMSTHETMISVIIPVRDRWGGVRECVKSILLQDVDRLEEVIVVDDGSSDEAPGELMELMVQCKGKVLRQAPSGVSTARNMGWLHARGGIVLFVDSDCTLGRDCLERVWRCIDAFPDDSAFQARIIGTGRGIVGRIEELDKRITQEGLTLKDGCIRWLNTAGFALRKGGFREDEVFDPAAARGQDTLLLVKLAQENRLPRYMSEALVYHRTEMSLLAYLTKGLRVGYVGAPLMTAGRGSESWRFSRRGRLEIVRKLAGETIRGPSIAPVLFLVHQMLKRIGRVGWRLAGGVGARAASKKVVLGL